MAASRTRATSQSSVSDPVERFVDVGGARTRYFEAGDQDAPPLILCHGAGWFAEYGAHAWRPVLDGFGRSYHVFAPDKLASGLTDNPPQGLEDFTIEAEVEHLFGFMEAVGIAGSPLNLLGDSRGAYLAARVALERPEQVLSLIMTDTNTLAPEIGSITARRERVFVGTDDIEDPREQMRAIHRALSAHGDHVTEEFIEESIVAGSLPKAEETRRLWAAGGEERHTKSIENQKPETLAWLKEGRLNAPILLLWGRDDPLALLEQGLQLFDLLAPGNPRLRMYIANDTGHCFSREFPDEFVAVVSTFIEEASRVSAATSAREGS